jgi:hypothetical protein
MSLAPYLVFDDAATGIFVNVFKANAPTSATPPTNIFTIDKTCSDITIWEPDVSGPTAWIDSGANDTIYLAGQFHTAIKGAAGTNISGDVTSGTSATLPTLNFGNSSSVSLAEFTLSSGWGGYGILGSCRKLRDGEHPDFREWRWSVSKPYGRLHVSQKRNWKPKAKCCLESI